MMRRLAIVLSLALMAVAGLWWSRWDARQARGQTAPAVMPLVVKPASKTPVVFDGHVSKFEYGDATHMTFANGHGTVDVYSKCVDGMLYFAFQIPDLSPFAGDDIVIMLDPAHQRAAAPAKGNTRAYVRRKMENSRMQQGTGEAGADKPAGKWADYYGDWEYRSALYETGWEVEARIPLKSLGVAAGKKTTLGLAFRIWDNEPLKTWNWPAGSDENKPDTWGELVVEAGSDL